MSGPVRKKPEPSPAQSTCSSRVLLKHQRGKWNLDHIVSCCPKALGRETDGSAARSSRLSQRASRVASPTSVRRSKPRRKNINLIRAEEKSKRTSREHQDWQDWQDGQPSVGLGSRLQFPWQVAQTALRPDIVPAPQPFRIAVCAVEEWTEEAFEHEKDKCDSLVSDCQRQNWTQLSLPAELTLHSAPQVKGGVGPSDSTTSQDFESTQAEFLSCFIFYSEL